jgi:hypothetical protein
MITPELISYIQLERSKSTSDDVVRASLKSNGWNEADIAEAFAQLAKGSASPQQLQATAKELKAHRRNITWSVFGILIIADAIIIMFMGGQGLFGISPLSIILRIVVIYGIASFTSIGSRKQKNTTRTVIDTVARVIAGIFLAWVILIGALFLFCLFAFNGKSL